MHVCMHIGSKQIKHGINLLAIDGFAGAQLLLLYIKWAGSIHIYMCVYTHIYAHAYGCECSRTFTEANKAETAPLVEGCGT